MRKLGMGLIGFVLGMLSTQIHFVEKAKAQAGGPNICVPLHGACSMDSQCCSGYDCMDFDGDGKLCCAYLNHTCKQESDCCSQFDHNNNPILSCNSGTGVCCGVPGFNGCSVNSDCCPPATCNAQGVCT